MSLHLDRTLVTSLLLLWPNKLLSFFLNILELSCGVPSTKHIKVRNHPRPLITSFIVRFTETLMDLIADLYYKTMQYYVSMHTFKSYIILLKISTILYYLCIE